MPTMWHIQQSFRISLHNFAYFNQNWSACAKFQVDFFSSPPTSLFVGSGNHMLVGQHHLTWDSYGISLHGWDVERCGRQHPSGKVYVMSGQPRTFTFLYSTLITHSWTRRINIGCELERLNAAFETTLRDKFTQLADGEVFFQGGVTERLVLSDLEFRKKELSLSIRLLSSTTDDPPMSFVLKFWINN